jgi:hypothetical protein
MCAVACGPSEPRLLRLLRDPLDGVEAALERQDPATLRRRIFAT